MFTVDSHGKTFVKTLSYRFSSSLITATIIYLFTNEWQLSLFIGGIDFLIKLIWYYVHERLWGKTAWGEVPEKK